MVFLINTFLIQTFQKHFDLNIAMIGEQVLKQ